MICMSALLMLAVSCKKDKKDEIENAGSGFRATVESHAGDSKTHLDGLAVKWDSGDAILVKSNTCTTPRGFTTQESGDNVNFDADATLPTNFYAPPYTGYYPASAFEGDQLTLPATQTYVAGSFGNGANPMAATSSETLLPFKNICGVLKLQLHGTSAYGIDNITITSNTGEMLWGTGTVTLTNGIPTLGTLSDGGSTLTLNCGGQTMSTSSSSPTNYYFVVPAGTLGTSFTVKVTATNGDVWTKTTSAQQNLVARSQITVLPEQSVATHAPVKPSEVTVTAGCVDCTYTVSGSVTVPSGTHTCEYGLVYCPSSSGPLPTIGDSKIVVNTENFSGTKNFTADLGVLEVGVEYKVRAYAMIDGVTYSSESTVKTVTGGNVPQAMTWTGGKSPKQFSVSASKKVYFSQGNLQYLAQGGSGGNASATAASGANVGGTWRFAEHQFDFIGAANAKAAQTYDGWIDLFGWGTSGYSHGAVCFQPWSTSTTYSDYYAYGASGNNLEGGTSPHTGKADWGKANVISNGGGSSWRTLTSAEWKYLISTRKDGSGKLLYGEGMVGNCTPGLIILPDDWSCPTGVTDVSRGTSSWSNVYSYSQWAQLEAAGAVFLPAAGRRDGTSVYFVGSSGYYWSSSYCNINNAYYLNFNSGTVYPSSSNYFRYNGFSVRLVSEN